MDAEIHDGMESLSLGECQRLLRAGGVGILALRGETAPILRPVNFHFETSDGPASREAAPSDGSKASFDEMFRTSLLWMRTGEGRILEAASEVVPASFAISAVDPLEHSGWSVVVMGRLRERSTLDRIDDLPLRPWARTTKNHFVSLSIEAVSGRRIATAIEGL